MFTNIQQHLKVLDWFLKTPLAHCAVNLLQDESVSNGHKYDPVLAALILNICWIVPIVSPIYQRFYHAT